MASAELPPDLVMTNARVITMDDSRAPVEAVAMSGGKIAWLGTADEAKRRFAGIGRVIDCAGKALLPGFVDAHFHLAAYASSLVAIDCTPAAVSSISDIKRAVAYEAARSATGSWIRGHGYDEFHLAERRHPTRWELDEAAPDHPVRLTHRSGHASVLNTRALEAVGISNEFPEPPSATIDRDPTSGEISGVLLEMEEYLHDHMPRLPAEEYERGLRLAEERLLSYGITSLQDASATNDLGRWSELSKTKADGKFRPNISMMPGWRHLMDFVDHGLRFGGAGDQVGIGHAKIVLTQTSARLYPDFQELCAIVEDAHELGFPVAIHAVEREAVDAAVNALALHRPAGSGRLPAPDRIEHCSEISDASLEKLARTKAVIVTQPGFIYHGGDRYLAEVELERQRLLYRIGSLKRAGVTVAGSSDAPVIDPNPLYGVYGAVARKSASGRVVGPDEVVSRLEALHLYTSTAARAIGRESSGGRIAVGEAADLVLLDEDPTAVSDHELLNLRVVMTLIGGLVVWEA
ncbi:MAG: amidohydrolase [Chloroflexi bacterium]|nr:amidohydrolase [Chloroflexota bacterium]